MKKLFVTTALVAAVGFGPAALAECDERISEFRTSAAEREMTMGAPDRNILRSLVQSARSLSDAGYEDACGTVVEAMEEYVEARAERAEEEGGAMTEDGRMADDEMVGLMDAPEGIRRADLVGKDLYGLEEDEAGEVEYLGSVDGVLLGEGGKLTHLIVGVGGILGIGDREVAVPADMIKVFGDGDDLFAPVTEERLEDAPDYDETDEGWKRDTNDEYYQ